MDNLYTVMQSGVRGEEKMAHKLPNKHSNVNELKVTILSMNPLFPMSFVVVI